MWINDKRKPQDTWRYYILIVKRHELGYGPSFKEAGNRLLPPSFYYRVISNRIDTSVYKVK
jgi:hypothetical protein